MKKFCHNCGKSIEPLTAKFCMFCGTDLSSLASVAPVIQQPAPVLPAPVVVGGSADEDYDPNIDDMHPNRVKELYQKIKAVGFQTEIQADVIPPRETVGDVLNIKQLPSR
jgi:hypothetical protein